MVGVSVTSEFEHAVQGPCRVDSCTGWRRGPLMQGCPRGRQGAAGAPAPRAAERVGRSRRTAAGSLRTTTVEAWRTEGVLVSAQQRLRHEVPWTMILASSAAY